MIDKIDKNDCYGCYACINSCPQSCIIMKEDKEGFFYPKIDMDKCVGCNKCEVMCPACGKDDYLLTEDKKFYAAYHLNEQVRKRSSSGGIFYALAQYVIENKGYVCAASFNRNFEVEHQLACKMEEIEKMQGSKYAQSKLGFEIKNIKTLLEQKKQVLFVGTPCQVAGIKNVIPKYLQNNLICVDLVCHGVPNNKLLKKYLVELSKDSDDTIERVSFRDKKNGWKCYSFCVAYRSGKVYRANRYADSYLRAFVKGLILRPSCYGCKYRINESGSDLTIGDFWNHKKYLKKRDDNKGLSLVSVQTEKGLELLEKSKYLKLLEVSEMVGISSEVKHEDKMSQDIRNLFFSELSNRSFEEVMGVLSPIDKKKYYIECIKMLIEKIIFMVNVERRN